MKIKSTIFNVQKSTRLRMKRCILHPMVGVVLEILLRDTENELEKASKSALASRFSNPI